MAKYKRLIAFCIVILILMQLTSCFVTEEETVSLKIGYTLHLNKVHTLFNNKYSANKDQIIQNLKTAEYKKADSMPDDFEAARIIFDEDCKQILMLAFDYETDVLYAKYENDIYTVQNYDRLVSFVGSCTDINRYESLSGVTDYEGLTSEENGSIAYWEGSWRIKKYFYNKDCVSDKVYIYNENSGNTVKTREEILEEALDFMEFKEKYLAFIMYDETSDKWLVNLYSNEEGDGESSYYIVLDCCGNVLWIYSPWNLDVPKKADEGTENNQNKA